MGNSGWKQIEMRGKPSTSRRNQNGAFEIYDTEKGKVIFLRNFKNEGGEGSGVERHVNPLQRSYTKKWEIDAWVKTPSPSANLKRNPTAAH